MTHCDRKPRGKVDGSAISVYQALLHSATESLGTRLMLTVLFVYGSFHIISTNFLT